jgi:membrane protein implicated in regulation of membrane protease activity
MPTILWLWLAAGTIFLIIEITTPGLVFGCFAIGAFGAAAATAFTDSYLIQLAVFAVIPIILIPLTRPLARKITKPSPQSINVDAMVGREGMVVKAIDPDSEVGQVRVDGQVWQVLASEKIAEGTRVKVDKVQGARLHVSKIEDMTNTE